MAYSYDEDEWYSGLNPAWRPRYVQAPRRPPYADRRPTEFLVPGGHHAAGGIHRTRSVGHAPVPNIHVHNYMDQHQEAAPSPQPSPRGRPVRLAEDDLLDELEATRREFARSRSRGRFDAAYHHYHHHHDDPWRAPALRFDMQLELAQQRQRDAEARWQREQEEELIRRRVELQYMKNKAERDAEEARIRADEERYRERLKARLLKEKQEQDAERERAKAEAEKIKKEMELEMLKQQREREEEEERLEAVKDKLEKEFELKQEQEARKREKAERDAEELKKRIILENTAKIQKAEADAKEAKERAIYEYERKKAKEEQEAKDERQRIIDEYEKKKVDDADKQRKMEEALIAKLKKQEEDRKAREEAEWKEFLRKQKEKEEEEAAKTKKKEEELAKEMHDRLAQFGFVENQIQAMIDPKKTRELQQGQSPANPLQLARQPTYIKVHRDHLSIDTLTYYGLPWERDRDDDRYIIILCELDRHQTDALFEHTRSLRRRGTAQLLIEQRNPHKQEYAWVRRKATPSPNGRRRRTSPKRFGLSALLL